MKISKGLIIILIFIILVIGLGIAYKNSKIMPENIVSIYLVKLIDKEKTEVVSVTRKVPHGNEPINIAISELLKGPTLEEKKNGYFTEIPDKTILLGIRETQDRIIVNLSEDFGINGGSSSMTTRLKQFNYTVLDVIKDKPVYLELGGKPAEYIGGEGVEVSQPLKKAN
ncbi:MAG: hypothetical protein A2104_01425 [Candidatus Melainabacteria bacterium GWF2_32_7]|nr:MAG: hypothetical protein A2104_01425 [Candidatus Melainabacteria bacterium GWF2_32_7]